jgi:aspartate racemase
MSKMIGVVGGVGSYAGLDLVRKIYDYTGAASDQDHLPVSMLSVPNKILDRSKFLLKEIEENPGYSIAEIITTLTRNGAEIIGIPCNTAHAPEIFDVITGAIPSGCTIVHMIEEVASYIKANFPEFRKVGVLSTNGTHSSNIYPITFLKYGIEVIQPPIEIQHNVIHPAIYDRHYGIKSCSNPVSETARRQLLVGASFLERMGAEAIILGCTEIPLAIDQSKIGDSVVIDSTSVLARALIRKSREMIPAAQIL